MGWGGFRLPNNVLKTNPTSAAPQSTRRAQSPSAAWQWRACALNRYRTTALPLRKAGVGDKCVQHALGAVVCP